jgi:hypothetical protein
MILHRKAVAETSDEEMQLATEVLQLVLDFTKAHPATTLNDILEGLTVVIGVYLAGVPDSDRQGLYGSIGKMLWEQATMQRATGQFPQIEVVNEERLQ